MTILTNTQFTKFLKTVYDGNPETVWFPECPFVAYVPKSYDFDGENRVYGILYEGIRTANSFAVAQSGKSTPGTEKFTVTPISTFCQGSINNRTLRGAKARGALAPALKTMTDSAFYSFGESVSAQAWGDGTGTRGTVGSFTAGVITLAEPRDSVKFFKGQVLESKTGGVLNGGTLLITKIQRKLGKLTVTQVDAHPDPVADDILASEGDYTAGVATGVQAWVPETVAAGDSHFGCNRSVDRERLAGHYINCGGMSVEEAVFEAAADMSIAGGKARELFINDARFATLQKSMHSKAWFPGKVEASGKGKATIGFEGIQFTGPKGPVTVVPDRHCPPGKGLMTHKDAWELICLGGLPHWSDEDGQKLLRETSADAQEFRLAAYWQLVLRRPVDAAILDFDTAA